MQIDELGMYEELENSGEYSNQYVEDTDIEYGVDADEYQRNLEALDKSPSSFNFDNFIANELGAPDGRIVTGSPDNPIYLNISELSDIQKVALLKHHYTAANNSKDSGLSEDESYIISKLRNGELEDLYNDLSVELGKNINSNTDEDYDVNSYEPDSIVLWNLQQQYPNMTPEELEEQLEITKNLPNYNKILDASTKKLQSFFESQLQQTQSQKQREYAQVEQARTNELINIASQVEHLHGFELSDNDKNEALALLIEKNQGSNMPILQEYLQTPQGLLEAAFAMTALPKISAQYEKMLSELEQYEKKTVKPKAFVQSTQQTKKQNSFNDPFTFEEI